MRTQRKLASLNILHTIVLKKRPRKLIINLYGKKRNISSIEKLPIQSLWNNSCIESMLSFKDFKSYFKGQKTGYLIKLKT